jgi:cyclic beta-1,2-glucan synthetase
MSMVRELLHAHEYLRLKGLIFDFVILNEQSASYFQHLQDELQRQIRICGSKAILDKAGGVFLRRRDLMPEEDVLLLKTVARVSLQAGQGSLEAQLARTSFKRPSPKPLRPATREKNIDESPLVLPDLQFFNGLGGFGSQGREYVIVLKEGQWTPAPWINVIANSQDFGFICSEAGSGYTWSTNSRENRLTPWSNDAVSDSPGEAFFIRDEDTGEFWSPTPLPVRDKGTYVIRHGRGYSSFHHTCLGIEQSLEMFVPLEDPVKILRLKLKNLGSQERSLSVTSYFEWVLGFQRGASAPFIITELDTSTSALLARNPYNNEFSERIAFVDLFDEDISFTCDRNEFIGSLGDLSSPEAMRRGELSGASGAGLDPCAAFRSRFTLKAGETREFVVQLGQTDTIEHARTLILKYRDRAKVERAFVEIRKFWSELFDVIQIRTPDEAMNIMMNGWLLYQTLSCRVWARSAFYQSGGAYGFRDQLQDVMALVYSKPELARSHLLRAAQRQFKEGDVQHWWHPPSGRGVRTRCSDDLLWLPFVTSFYVEKTGDVSVLEEELSFIEGPGLPEGKDDDYMQPKVSSETSSLREHCALALDRSLKVGRHGLPLIGSCDWNDGMSHVGHKGQGESVWMAWFLYATMRDFIPYLQKSGDLDRVEIYQKHLEDLKVAVESEGWDGDWYRRAYFDDGTPLGSASNDECRIDSIAQSWSVLSGAGDPQRSVRAMAAVDEYLVDHGEGLVRLFMPPFDKGVLNPGYIKGYLPGVRENGGQYTHAAIWALMAFAELGEGDRAGELYSLLNPINHASTRAGAHKYKVEPYVAAADIYGLSPHVGRGGWTWYTGSASWMYRAALESILGFDLRGDVLRVRPCVPSIWLSFEILFRWRSTRYRIVAIRSLEGISESSLTVRVDGKVLPTSEISLVDDGLEHEVEVNLG